jgi:hypothetical protein
MALWGNKDGAPFGALTASVAADPGLNLLTFSGSISSYGIEPGNTIIVDTAGTPQFVRVKQVISDTVIETTTNMTAVAAVDCEFQQSPKYTSITDVTAGNIVGADLSEVAQGGTTDPGWLRKYTKTRDGVTVTLFETLVASSSINEDVVNEEFANIVPPAAFSITLQPQDLSYNSALVNYSSGDVTDRAGLFTFNYTYSGSGQDKIYWQISTDGGSTWQNIVDSAYLSYFGNETTYSEQHTYSTNPDPNYPGSTALGIWHMYNDVTLNGFQFRVMLTDDTDTVYSDVATLTVT